MQYASKTLLYFGASLGIFAFTVSVRAQNLDTSVIRYHRAEIPEEQIQDFVDGLVPRLRTEFETLTTVKHDDSRKDYAFRVGEYSAELTDDLLIKGTAKLTRNMASSVNAVGPKILQLGGRLAIQSPQWKSTSATQAAVIGIVDGQAVVADNPVADTLVFDWSAKSSQESDVLIYVLDFPKAEIQRLRIRTPRNRVLYADQGVTSRNEENSTSRDTVDWSVSWSGQNKIRLTLSPVRDPTDVSGHPSCRQVASYSIGATGIRLSSQLHLEPGSDPLTTLTLLVDPALAVNNVEADGRPLIWSTSTDKIFVDLPRKLWAEPGRTSLLIQVDAIAELPDQQHIALPLPLPRIRPIARWREEVVRMNVLRPIELADIQMESCRCIKLDRDADANNEQAEFVMDSEFAKLRLQIAQEKPAIATTTLTNLMLDKATVTAKVETEIRPVAGELFELGFGVRDGWEVVENSIEAWTAESSVLDRYERADEQRLLLVSLRQAATQKSPVFIRFNLQRRLSSDPEPLEEFMPISGPVGERASDWLHIKPAPGTELLVDNVGYGKWRSADSSELPDWMLESMLMETGDLLLRWGASSRRVTLRRRTKLPPPQVSTDIQVHIDEDLIRQSVRFDVDPLGSELTGVVVSVTEPIPTANWRLSDRGDETTVTRVDSTNTSESRGLKQYTASFSARTEPFSLHLDFSRSYESAISIPLFSVRNANNESNRVAIFNSPRLTCELTTQALTPIPPISLNVDPDQHASICGAFAYNLETTSDSSLAATSTPAVGTASIVSWRCDVRSFFTEQGRPRHRADFYLQQGNSEKFECTLPAGCALEGVEIDGVKVVPQPRLIDDMVTVALNQTTQFPCVSVRYLGRDQTLRSIDWLRPPVPTCDSKSLQTTWQVWLPQTFRAYGVETYHVKNGFWPARLFGPFAEDPSKYFTPFIHALRRRIGGGRSVAIQVRQMEFQLSDRVDRAVDNGLSDDGQPATWGSRLLSIQSDLERSTDFNILIDRQELRRLGVFPDTPLPASRYPIGPERSQGHDRLVQAGLAVVMDGPRAIVTSAAELRMHSELVDGIADEGTELWFSPFRLITLEDWKANRDFGLWRPPTDDMELGLIHGGWKPYRHAVDVASTMKIYHRDTVTALACVCFLLGFTIGWWVFKRNRKRWFAVVGAGFAMTLVLPNPGAALAVAFAWATLLSGLFRHVSVLPQRRLTKAATGFPMEQTRAAVWCVVFSASCLWDAPIHAQQDIDVADATTFASRDSDWPTVFFPVDQQRELTDIVYLTPKFYRELRAAQRPQLQQTPYLLTASSYSGDWTTPNDTSLELRVTLAVTTLQPSCRIELPTFGADARIDVSSIMQDNKRIQVQMDGVTRYITIAQTGSYRIMLKLAVPIQHDLNEHFIRFPIPVTPESELLLNLPRRVVKSTVPSALAGATYDAQRGTLRAQLGTDSELDIRATFPASSGGEKAGVDQLVLVRLEHHEVKIETRFLGDRGEGKLQFQDDPHVPPTLEPLGTDWSVSEFSMEISPKTDRIAVPWLKPDATRIRNRWVAIESSDTTEVDVIQKGLTSIAAEQFIQAWGELAPASRVIFSSTSDDPIELHLTRPATKLSWTSETTFLFGRDVDEFEVDAEYSLPADATPVAETLLRLAVPSSMHVVEVDARSVDVHERVRWRNVDGGILLFLHDVTPLSTFRPLTLSIRGELERSQAVTRVLPLISPKKTGLGDITVSHQVELYGSADVAVQVLGPEVLVSEVDESVTNRPGYRFFGTWQWDGIGEETRDSAFSVSRTNVDATISGSQTTKLDYDENGWTLELTIVANTADGDFDSISLDMPVELTGSPMQAYEDDVELRVGDVRDGPGRDRRIATVWLPRKANAQTRTITLSTRIEQERTSLPNVKLLNFQLLPGQHIVQLPDASENSLFKWRITGLATDPSGASGRYIATTSNFSAELEEVQISTFQPEVHLLDTTVHWNAGKRYTAISSFDLKPPQSSSCFLKLPARAQLLHVFVDDRRVEMTRQKTAGNTWQLDLSVAPWPQRVRVIYAGMCDFRYDGTLSLSAPQLLAADNAARRIPIKIHNELWSVYASHGAGTAELVDGSDELIDEQYQDELTISSFNSLWNSSRMLVSERPPSEQHAVRRMWSQRFAAIVQRFEERRRMDDDPDLQHINQLLADYENLFGGPTSETFNIAAPRARQLWRESRRMSGRGLTCISKPTEANELPYLRIRYPKVKTIDETMHYWIAALFAFCPFVLPKWKIFRRIVTWAEHFPHLVLGLVGLFWWCVLIPNWLGILIVLTSIGIWTSGMLHHRRLVLPK